MIIGLCGRRLCGKNTTGDVISDMTSNYAQIGFADSLKDEYSKRFKVPIFDLHTVGKKEIHRVGLQNLSEEMKKEYGEGVFAEIFIKKLQKENLKNVIITDMRFLIELEECAKGKERFAAFRVHSDLPIRIQRGYVEGPADFHRSETEMGDLPNEFFQPYKGGVIDNNFLNVVEYWPTVARIVDKLHL